MKKLLLKKLSACLPALSTATIRGSVGLAFIVSVMMFSAGAHAQIVYTDVNPDSTLVFYALHGHSIFKNYNLDLNNDGNNDFTLTASAWSTNTNPTNYGRQVTASPLNGNAVKDTLVNSVNVTIPLPFNAIIDSNLISKQSWQTSGLNILKDTNWYSFGGPSGSGSGLWNNLSNYYLGLRLLQSGQTYYGWVRLRLNYDSLIIYDYAYNSIPDQPILAGQTIATRIIKNSFASSINLFPNPAGNHLTIDLGSNNKKAEISIADITGKIIYSIIATDTQKAEVNTDDFAAGIYIVQIQTAGFIGSRKLLIEK